MLVAGVWPSVVSAQDATNTANTLKVSPVRTDLEIKPGESKVVQITVTNLTGGAITVRPVANDFVSGDESGTPALILDEDQFAPSHSLKRFMAPLSDVTIPAEESETIEVVITVPKTAQVGGYFGAVRFAPASPDGGGQVNLSASVASLILLTVPGDINESMELTNFAIQQDGVAGSFFTSSENIQVLARFRNSSDVQLGPFGKVSVKNGDKVIYETDFNNKSPRDVILPDSARRWEIPLNDIGGLGRYTVNATFTYGQNNQTIEVARSFWVIPVWAIIVAAIILLLLIGGIVAGILLYRRRKKNRTTPPDTQQPEQQS